MQLIDPEFREKRATFFRLIFGQSTGYVCIATLKNKKFAEEFYQYPAELGRMLEAIEYFVTTHNVYFCPQLLADRKRDKGQIAITPNVWADLDACAPDNLYVEPTVTVQTSPGRWQAYWVMDKIPDPDDAEDLSRRIAYKHAEEGADRSGWDLTQLLRVPFTYNFKYPDNAEMPAVQIVAANRNLYRISDFHEYPEAPEYVAVTIPMPAEEDLPPVAEDLLQEKRKVLNPLIWKLFSHEPDTGKWSQDLWNLEMLLFEAGFTREEVYVIAREAKCNKYARDGKPVQLLWKDVCRAEAKASYHQTLMEQPISKDVQLITDEELALVESTDDTFVERYIKWACSLGDAAPQYHQAGAFTILSSLLCGSVRLPTSYGTIIPNVWFMILADTTLTRKTTSMDIAMDLAMEIDDNIVMATDGSIEGLLTSLGTRPGKPSVFLRDEFSGLLESMIKKDYMAGMAEMFTKLYDGKMQKRILRKEIVEVRDPRMIIYAGGIKNKITSLLTFEHVSSGFIPRFIFITAESDISRLKPIGPPSQRTTGNKDAILAEMTDIHQRYNRTVQMQIKKLKTTIERTQLTDAALTDEAWIRYNTLEAGLLDAGIKSQRPEIMTPVGDRLAKSILKCAVLIAASRSKGEEITVEMVDLLRALKYGQGWYRDAIDVMNNVGKGSGERQIDNVMRLIDKHGGNGVSRSVIMQWYHLSSREASLLFDTLEQRGLITRQKAGRTELLVSTMKG